MCLGLITKREMEREKGGERDRDLADFAIFLSLFLGTTNLFNFLVIFT